MTRPWIRWGVLSLIVVAVAHLGDPWAWGTLRRPDVYEKDWGRLLRSLGYLPTWGAIALAYWLQQRGTPTGGRTAGFLIVTPALGGLAAEVLKLLFRRLRPDPAVFGYVFRPFTEQFWSNRGMGLPSSHTLVAFAGAAALAAVFPRARWVFLALAAGCGVTRVLAGAHYLSDVAVAGCLGVGVGWLMSRWWQRTQAPESYT
ncbi:MAG: phosphatase PAP2 family protein [Gemmatimonadetes bacterium]|nr:phosphatase PAP2 family protein [Gemmatimonadota bacterium]